MNINNKKINIIPTVMPDSATDFKNKINFVHKFVKRIQIDVMDGNYVPSVSWPYKNLNDSYFKALISQEEGLPYWDKINYEVDLMVKNQLEQANIWIDIGVDRIIGHYQAFKNQEELNGFLNLKNERGVEVFLALKNDDSLNIIDNSIEKIDGIQFMGIDNIGYQGQEFNSEILQKIKKTREKYPNLTISIDGGVSEETYQDLIDAGVDNLSSGSMIFDSENPMETIKILSN